MCTKAHVDTLALLTQTEVALKEHERVCRFGRRAPKHVYSSRVVPDIALRQRLSRWRYVKQTTRPEISWLTFVTAGRQKTNRERVGEYAPGQGKVLEAIRLEGEKGCVCVFSTCKAPKIILTEVQSHREAQGETGWDRVERYCASTRWGHTDPINRTLSLPFRRFQFTKSSRQTINVCIANVKTSLTHIKSSQGHCKCALMLAWDQTGPIKCDLKQAGGGWSSA